MTPQEREIFVQVYRFYDAYSEPPANQDANAVDWWKETMDHAGQVYSNWNNHKLMEELLFGTIRYLESKAKEKTEVMNDFVQEQ